MLEVGWILSFERVRREIGKWRVMKLASRGPTNSRGRVREMSCGIFGVILGGRNEPFCVLPGTFDVCTRATPLNRHSTRIKLARVLNQAESARRTTIFH